MTILRCPLCEAPLKQQGQSLSCDSMHQFDLAKEGYINLLPVQFKKSKQPGDSQPMVQARRRFLSSGHYQFLRDAVAQKVKQLHQANSAVIDMGCGEGYYTGAIASALEQSSCVYGFDIAKPAIRYGAKRYTDCTFCVASTKRMPVTDTCASVVTSIFAPLFEQEAQRVLQEQGFYVVVSPGPDHLKQLKALIYKEIKQHQAVAAPAGFTEYEQTLIKETLNLDGEQACDLAQMTPFAWKIQPEQWDELRSQPHFEVEAQFYISVFQKIS